MPIEPVPFVHYIVDFSLREIVTAEDENIVLCEIASNVPFSGEYLDLQDGIYCWSRVVKQGKPFGFQSGCFCFILLKNCVGDMGVFAISHSLPDDPAFQTLIYEGDELVVAKPSDVSLDLKANFDFAWFSAGQRLRIETIPDIETHDRFRMPLLRKREEKP